VADAPPGAGQVVLLVDDDAAIRKAVASGLELEGFEVVPASGGRAALAAAEQVHPAVVLLDLGMPDLDGMEVLRRLRGDGDDVPVCVLSARDEVDDRVLALQEGATTTSSSRSPSRRSPPGCTRCCAGAPRRRAR
jgi:DNA-binding response OmpR family regulator